MRRKPLDRAYFFDHAILLCFMSLTHSPEWMDIDFAPYPIGIDAANHHLNQVNYCVLASSIVIWLATTFSSTPHQTGRAGNSKQLKLQAACKYALRHNILKKRA